MSRKFSFSVILSTICLMSASCTVQTVETTAVSVQTEEETADEETSEISKVSESSQPSELALNEASTADDTGEEMLDSIDEANPLPSQELSVEEHRLEFAPEYMFGEIQTLMSERGLQWEAYYNVSGDRVDMYCEDGTKLMFLASGKGFNRVPLKEMALIMENNQFYQQGFQSVYQVDLEQSADLDYYPQTAEYYVTESELMAMNQTALRIALHEIYARHGMQMTDPFLKAVFSQKTWYIARYEADDFINKQESLLNKYEKENVNSILAVQKKRNFTDDLEVDYSIPRSIVDGSCIDLDENGSRDKIEYTLLYAGPNAAAKSCVVYIGVFTPGKYAIKGEIEEMIPAIYTASLDGKTKQLILCGKMGDGKQRTEIYVYQNGETRLAGVLAADNLEIMSDCFWAYQYDEQQLKKTRVKYIFQNGVIVETGIAEAVGDDDGNDSIKMGTLIDSLDFEDSRVVYTEVVEALERAGVRWESEPNSSGERLDLRCDNGTEFVFMETGLDEKELIMTGSRLSEKGFVRVFKHERDASPKAYYYPQTSIRLLAADELNKMTQTELSIARNEIYARHGRRFENSFLHAVFSRKTWYKPKYEDTEFSGMVDQLFNTYEKENIKLLVAAEKELRD